MLAPLDDLAARVRLRRRQLDAEAGEARATARRGKHVEQEVETLKEQVERYERVAILLNSVAEERQRDAQLRIEGIVTRGLQVVFEPGLSFHIVQATKGKTTVADFEIRTTLDDGTVVATPIMEARGGGLAAVVGVLLRVTVLLLQDAKADRLLLLDESFAMVSAEYLDRLGEFLRELVERTGIQIVMVTHQPTLAEYADRAYRFTLDNHAQTRVQETTP